MNDLRQCQQLRTHSELRPPHRIGVNREPDVIFFGLKFNGPSRRCKTVHIADRKNVFPLEEADHFFKTLFFRRADKRDLAKLRLGEIANCGVPVHFNGSVTHGSPSQVVIQLLTKRILPNHTNYKRRVGSGETGVRPLNEFRKIE